MVRVHQGRPTIIQGRHEAENNGLLTAEQIMSVPLEPSPLQLAEIVRRVDIHKQQGWNTEEIQQGYQNEQTATS